MKSYLSYVPYMVQVHLSNNFYDRPDERLTKNLEFKVQSNFQTSNLKLLSNNQTPPASIRQAGIQSRLQAFGRQESNPASTTFWRAGIQSLASSVAIIKRHPLSFTFIYITFITKIHPLVKKHDDLKPIFKILPISFVTPLVPLWFILYTYETAHKYNL